MRPAEDAILIATDHLDLDGVVQEVLRRIHDIA
jgi:cytidylate kinase